jgi:hypothetical protein
MYMIFFSIMSYKHVYIFVFHPFYHTLFYPSQVPWLYFLLHVIIVLHSQYGTISNVRCKRTSVVLIHGINDPRRKQKVRCGIK